MSDLVRPKIGVDSVYVAALTLDNGTDAPTYGTPARLAGAAKVSGNPNSSLTTDFGDNKAMFTANARGALQASIELLDVDPDVLALVLGQTRANGITEESATDMAPYYALGFRVWLGGTDDSGDKVYEYFWYVKGRFAIPTDQGAETKKDKINPQHTTLMGEFIALEYNEVMCVHGRTDVDLTAAAAAAWFTNVVYTSSQSLTAVTFDSVVGDAGAHTITLTFGKGGETFSLVEPDDNTQVRVFVASTGLFLAGTYTYAASAAGTTPTLVITNSNISGVPYTVFVDSLKDNNGVTVTPKGLTVTPA